MYENSIDINYNNKPTNPPKVKIFCQCETKIMSLIFYLKEISNNNKALPKQQS